MFVNVWFQKYQIKSDDQISSSAQNSHNQFPGSESEFARLHEHEHRGGDERFSSAHRTLPGALRAVGRSDRK